MVTPAQLKELFRAPLLTMPNMSEADGPLVNNVDLAADGKFAFVEFRDETIAAIALTLFDKMEVCGRALNVGRPRGYIESGATAGASGAPASCFGGPLAVHGAPPPPPPPMNGPTSSACIKLEGMLDDEILPDDEHAEIVDDIKQECESSGHVARIAVPRDGPNRNVCFVMFDSAVAASVARASLDKRQFDGNVVRATFIDVSDMPPPA